MIILSRWTKVINLVETIEVTNDYGDVVIDRTSRQVFANKKSIRQSEFYQAATTDYQPELMFEIRYIDFNDEPELEYEDKLYNIIRTYSKNGEIVELICQKVKRNGST